jgi:hypothetical protein
VLAADDVRRVKGLFPRGKEFTQAVLAPSGDSSGCAAADVERVGLREGVHEDDEHGAGNRRTRRADRRAGGQVREAIDDVVETDAPKPGLVVVGMPGFKSREVVVNCITRNEAHTRGSKGAE